MLVENEIKNIFKKHNINVFKVLDTKNDFSALQYLLGDNNIDDFIEFVSLNNINTVFYNYSYYDIDKFLILPELLEELDDEIYQLVIDECDRHNEYICSLDFERPIKLDIFCKHEIGFFYIYQLDLWDEDYDLHLGKDVLCELCEKYEYIIEQRQQEIDKEKEFLLNEFFNYIWNDDNFKKCTNQSLRRNYVFELFKRDDMQKFKKLFLLDKGIYGLEFDRTLANSYVENLWKDLKEFIRENKNKGK